MWWGEGVLLLNSGCTYLDSIAKKEKKIRGDIFTFYIVLMTGLFFCFFIKEKINILFLDPSIT